MNASQLNRAKLLVVVVAVITPVALAVEPGLTPLHLDQAGVFFIGGQGAMSGTGIESQSLSENPAVQITGQSLVHYFVPSEKRDVAIVLYPGLGLTSYIYLATPDGHEGWATLLARERFATYVFDVPNTGISGFDIAPFNRGRRGDIDVAAQPSLAIWNHQQIWSRWGFGAGSGMPHENTRFPVDDIGQFLAAMNPRVGGGRGGGGRRAANPDAPDPVLRNFIQLLRLLRRISG